MNTKIKLALTISVLMLLTAIAALAFVALWAARQQQFNSDIVVKYVSTEVSGEATARWKVGSEDWKDMTTTGEVGGSTTLTFGEKANENATLSPTDKNIKLSSQNNYVVFEYSFFNQGGHDFAIDVSYTDDAVADQNMSVYCLCSNEQIMSDFSNEITTEFGNWNTSTIEAGGEKYLYFLAKITTISKDAKYSGSFNFTLDGKDYSDDVTFSSGTITGLKKDVAVLRIPSEIDGQAVTRIASISSETLTEVTIPDSVTKIDSNAFSSCRILDKVSIGTGVADISYVAFGCPKLTNLIYNARKCRDYTNDGYSSEIKDPFCGAGYNSDGVFVTIGDDVEVIPNYLFYNSLYDGNSDFTHTNITKITLGKNITRIGESAFCDLDADFGDLIIPKTCTTIGNGAFSGCKAKSITIEAGSIGNEAFYNINADTLTIGSGVTSIGQKAFAYMSKLTQINFNATNCANLQNDTLAFFGDTNANGIKVVIGDDCQIIPDYLFHVNTFSVSENRNNEPYITSFQFGKNLKKIGSYIGPMVAPPASHLLGELVFQDGLTDIGIGAFAFCGRITKVYIPQSVVNIGNGAFSSCSSLKEVTIDSEYVCNNIVTWEGTSSTKTYLINYATTINAKHEITGLDGYTKSTTQNAEGYWVYTKNA